MSWGVSADVRPQRFDFHETVNISRAFSYSDWGACPAFTTSISFAAQGDGIQNVKSPPSTPSGPFFAPNAMFFAEDLRIATVNWTGLAINASNVPRSVVELAIVDPRVAVTSARRSAHSVVVQVERARWNAPLHYVLRRRTLEGNSEEFHGLLEGNTIKQKQQESVYSWELYLLAESGFCFDHLHARADRPGVYGAILLGGRSTMDATHRDLLQAINSGEGDRIEFKEWLPPEDREEKYEELVRTVCAFANSAGGTLYLGVTDDAEIVGMGRRLPRWAGDRATSDAGREQLYVQALMQSVRQEIAPSVVVAASWITHGGKRILRLEVEPTRPAAAHHIVGRQEIFVRRGASNRRAYPEELRVLLNQPPTQRLGGRGA